MQDVPRIILPVVVFANMAGANHKLEIFQMPIVNFMDSHNDLIRNFGMKKNQLAQ